MPPRKGDFARHDQPPEHLAVIEVIRCREYDRFSFVILSRAMWGTFTHYIDRRTRACRNDRAACDLCKRATPRKWIGLIHVFAPDSRRQFFLELTPRSANMLLHQVGEKTLRGLLISVERARPQLRAPLNVTVTGNCMAELAELPEAKTPEATLRRLWGMDE